MWRKVLPGFSIRNKREEDGYPRILYIRADLYRTAAFRRKTCLGKQGEGFKIAMHTLDGGRIGIAAQALGLAEGALERTIEYVKERKQFGRAIGQFQNTQFQLADMATKVQAAQIHGIPRSRCKGNTEDIFC